jgi:hypothetical protein
MSMFALLCILPPKILAGLRRNVPAENSLLSRPRILEPFVFPRPKFWQGSAVMGLQKILRSPLYTQFRVRVLNLTTPFPTLLAQKNGWAPP